MKGPHLERESGGERRKYLYKKEKSVGKKKFDGKVMTKHYVGVMKLSTSRELGVSALKGFFVFTTRTGCRRGSFAYGSCIFAIAKCSSPLVKLPILYFSMRAKVPGC